MNIPVENYWYWRSKSGSASGRYYTELLEYSTTSIPQLDERLVFSTSTGAVGHCIIYRTLQSLHYL
jgi:hypothetical protein